MQDIDDGHVAEGEKACLKLCDDAAECNAVSFYTKGLGAEGKNCYPKMLEVSCLLPEDVSEDENAVLYLKCDFYRMAGKDYIPADADGGSSGDNKVQVKVRFSMVSSFSFLLVVDCKVVIATNQKNVDKESVCLGVSYNLVGCWTGKSQWHILVSN